MTMKKTSGTTPQTPVKWNFTTYTDAKGRTYVIAYHNRWDSRKKQSRIAQRRHVGRLDGDTGEVALSKSYLADHPEYAGMQVFYEANSLVARSDEEAVEIRKEAANAAEWRCSCVSVGLTWALWQMALDSGILASLQGVFGAEDGAELLRLGIYELCSSGGAMQNYEDWLAENYLPGAAPLDGWKISALLASVSQERIDAYFKDRYESIMERRRRAGLTSASGRPMLMAVDSTGISTWSETIGDAAYGHAKQDPFLKQVNLTICADYETGDACYAYVSEGSVNDMSLFPELLMRMQSAGFDLSEVLIVTDRGYSSMQNVQKQLNCGLKFLTGIRLSEDAVRRQLDKYEASLRDMAFLNGAMGVYARSAEPERWTSYGDGVKTEHSVHVHLYRNPRLEADQTLAFQCELEALLKARNAGMAVDASKWARYKKFLVQPGQGSAGDLQREGDRRVGVQAVQGAQRRSPPHGHGSVVQGKDPAASAGAGSKDDGDGQAAGQGQQPEGKAPRGLAGEGHVDPQEAPGLAACRPRSLADKGAPQVNQGAPAGPGSGPAWEDPEKLETRIPKV